LAKYAVSSATAQFWFAVGTEIDVDRHGDLPACARRSWSTCEDVLRAAEQSELAEF